MVTYVLYYLPLLDWRQNHLKQITSLLKEFFWDKKPGKAFFPHVNWNLISTPKTKGGLRGLDLSAHLHGRRATCMHHMVTTKLP